jgi:hypothetical protein
MMNGPLANDRGAITAMWWRMFRKQDAPLKRIQMELHGDADRCVMDAAHRCFVGGGEVSASFYVLGCAAAGDGESTSPRSDVRRHSTKS